MAVVAQLFDHRGLFIFPCGAGHSAYYCDLPASVYGDRLRGFPLAGLRPSSGKNWPGRAGNLVCLGVPLCISKLFVLLHSSHWQFIEWISLLSGRFQSGLGAGLKALGQFVKDQGSPSDLSQLFRLC